MILRHKVYVARYCFKLGLYWRGLTHDNSKLSPIEFGESCHYYTGDRSPIELARETKGYSKAWQHHKGRNTHHYEYWLDRDNAIKMPIDDWREMLCDWIGAAKSYDRIGFSYAKELEYVEKKLATAKMNESTKESTLNVFKVLVEIEKLLGTEFADKRFSYIVKTQNY